ncbi:MAG: UDP-N-acetylglucosamine 4,6-dehydratase (inverting) [Hyphomicrobiaceae bacterium]
MNRKYDHNIPNLTDRSFLVTGGTGSFGRAFVSRLLSAGPPRRLVIFSRDEQKQWQMEQELQLLGPDVTRCLRFFVGDVRDKARLELAMRGIDTVVHAAAMKIVPTAEYNPFECILTNVHGAENIVKAVLRTGVQNVIALSTDKAANPINLYGASKLASDKIFVAANNLVGTTGSKFSVVRYGNVIGSRGSVVPFFQRLIEEGAESLPITDTRMTRFWIALEQGVNFVLSSLALMRGGEIFVPKIPSMRVVDLAMALAPELPHRIVGIRPGEKLHEIMVTDDDARMTIELDDRYIICPPATEMTDTGEIYGSSRPVAEGFRYSSDRNDEWLDEASVRKLISAGT